MSDLQQQIADMVFDISCDGDEDYWATRQCHERIADAVLAIPEIAEALRLNTPLSEAIKMMQPPNA